MSGEQEALHAAVVDLCWRAQRYGETADGDTAYYVLTKGTMHRLIAAAQAAGIPAAFRSDDRAALADEGAADQPRHA